MATTQAKAAPRFDAPGPGTWEMDAAHFPRPVFGTFQRVFPAAFENGFRDCCARYGMLLETMDVKFVNGFPYMQPRIVGAPPGGSPPPKPIFFVMFKLLTTLHPEIRKRMAIAKTIFERRPWRDEIADWDTRVKPATIAAHRELDAMDVKLLDDAALGQHCLAVESHTTRMLSQDHSYNLTCMVPIGDYLGHLRRWTTLDDPTLMAPLRGFSDISAGDSVERRRLLSALRSDPQAMQALENENSPEERWQRLRSWPGEVGEAMQDYCLVFGNGLAHGLDLETRTINEDPGPALTALKAALEVQDDKRTHGASDAANAIRAAVPQAYREAFDVLLEDAQLTYRLRDERHLYGVMPTFGIARRVLMESGRRLVARGVLAEEAHALLCDAQELASMLEGRMAAPEDLLERAHLYATLSANDAPEVIGPKNAPPPSSWLPNDGARRLMDALDLFLGDMAKSASANIHDTIEGIAVSKGVVEGVARLCRTATDLDRVCKGDILVAPLTTPAINVVLPLLGGIVTDKGGALSHAAIVSREYGIPGVVGTREATARIADGTRVRVDGNTGVVTVL